MTSLPRIVPLSEIEKVVQLPGFHEKLVQGIADGFVQLQKSEFCAAPIQTLGAPPLAPFVANCENYAAQTCVKSGYFANNPYYVIKVASGGYPLPNAGNMQVYSQSTGRLVALLLDEGLLTELRTAAWSALILNLWLKQQTFTTDPIAKIGMLGTGVQARYQLDALQHETTCRHVVVYGRTAANVDAYQHDMEAKGWTVEAADDPHDLLEHCDVVVTTTPARTPVLRATSSSMRTRLLICIGADAVGKTELGSSLVQHAVLRVADSVAQSRQRGEFQGCSDTILDLGDWIVQVQQQQSTIEGLMIADSSGVALQDCIIAQMVYESL